MEGSCVWEVHVRHIETWLEGSSVRCIRTSYRDMVVPHTTRPASDNDISILASPGWHMASPVPTTWPWHLGWSFPRPSTCMYIHVKGKGTVEYMHMPFSRVQSCTLMNAICIFSHDTTIIPYIFHYLKYLPCIFLKWLWNWHFAFK